MTALKKYTQLTCVQIQIDFKGFDNLCEKWRSTIIPQILSIIILDHMRLSSETRLVNSERNKISNAKGAILLCKALSNSMVLLYEFTQYLNLI